jgi:hypothetical protein
MAKHVFYSFHYNPDCFRVSQVRNIGMVEANPAAHDNEWEAIKGGGTAAIQRWIDSQLNGRSCTVVMIGLDTAGRHWIDYEIEKSWNDGKGLLGVHIHNLKNAAGLQARKGLNPFVKFTMTRDPSKSLASLVHAYDPPVTDSKLVYAYIAANLSTWIDEAVKNRKNW